MPSRLSLKVPSRLVSETTAKAKRLADKVVKAALPKLAAFAEQALKAEADATLHRTAKPYKDAIKVTTTETGVTIELTSEAARMVEGGYDAFDIKRRMLAHAKHQGKNGPYIDVPFLQGVGQTASAVPGMPATLRSQMNAQKGSPARLRVRTPGKMFLRTINGQPTLVEHKRGLFDDMVRTAVGMGRNKVNEYRTFRRISAASDPASWWHPGFKGAHLLAKVKPKVQAEAKRIFAEACRDIGLKVAP